MQTSCDGLARLIGATHGERRLLPVWNAFVSGPAAQHDTTLTPAGAIPAWPHSRSWGYAPSGIVGVILLVMLVLFLMGRL